MKTTATILVLLASGLQAGCAVTFDQRVARFVEQSIAREHAERATRADVAAAYAATSVASAGADGIATTALTSSLVGRHDTVEGSDDCVVSNARASLVRGQDGVVRITRMAGPVSIACSIAPTKDTAVPLGFSRL